jgi:succinate-semialdehyde dehydrogenase/glutarate-semialdehyde dehydrogenase
MGYRTLNPATEELIETYPLATDAEIEQALAASAEAMNRWRRTSFAERAELLLGVADALESRAAELAGIMALEMGKPVAQGEAEARKCALGCRYFAEHGAELLQPVPYDSDGSEAFVRFDPLGPILAIMPWNFPLWQFYRFAAPTLMAGNTVILKHAPSTPRCALAIESMMRESGFSDGIVSNLFLSNEQAGAVVADDRVRGVTLTGSTVAGREVASTGGRHLKAMVMELGGSDPFVVTEDADLDDAVSAAVAARCQNSGQSCIASKRFLVHRDLFEEFTTRFVATMKDQIVGDPTAADTKIGPLARRDLRDRLAEQVDDSVAAGAEVLCGGAVPNRKGFFYPPTVLTNIPAGSPANGEELFGPVAALFPFDDDDHAIRMANDTAYGLGASVWTSTPERARRFAAEIEAGNVFVNGLVKSDPRLPFGGIKDSGFGRELSRDGVLEFVNKKTVWIR